MVSSRPKGSKVSKSLSNTNANNEKKTRSKEKVSSSKSSNLKNTNSRKRASTSGQDDQEVIKRPRLDEDAAKKSCCEWDKTTQKKQLENKEPAGTIMTFGQGDMGQLGLGEGILSRKKPALIKELSEESIRMVVGGGLHTICITTDNKVYSFGCNDEYALGRKTDDDESSEYLPRPIVGPLSGKPVVSVTAGDSHTAVLTDVGDVFVWGTFRDSHGSLGMLNAGEICKLPTLLDSIRECIISIASGDDHLVMVSTTGTVYSMGCGEQGQLGRIARYFVDRNYQRNSSTESLELLEREFSKESLLSPLKVAIPKVPRTLSSAKIIQAFCGAYTTWVKTSDGAIFAWGLNNCNQLGFSDNENRFRPQHCPLLSALSVKQIDGGLHHTLILNNTGGVFSMGLGQYGRLGLGKEVTHADEPVQIPNLPDIVSVSARGSVSFAVTNDGKAFAWGMGTNLQLSTGLEDDEWSPVRLSGKNLENRKVLSVAAGGQHTVLLTCSDEQRT